MAAVFDENMTPALCASRTRKILSELAGLGVTLRQYDHGFWAGSVQGVDVTVCNRVYRGGRGSYSVTVTGRGGNGATLACPSVDDAVAAVIEAV